MIPAGAEPVVILDVSLEVSPWRIRVTLNAPSAYRTEVIQGEAPQFVCTQPSLALALAWAWERLRVDHRSVAILLRAAAEAELQP